MERGSDQGFHFIGREHDGCEVEAGAEPVAHAGFSLDGHSGKGEVADVAVNRALRDLQPAGKLRGGGEAAGAQVLHDLEQAAGAAHIASVTRAAARWDADWRKPSCHDGDGRLADKAPPRAGAACRDRQGCLSHLAPTDRRAQDTGGKTAGATSGLIGI